MSGLNKLNREILNILQSETFFLNTKSTILNELLDIIESLIAEEKKIIDESNLEFLKDRCAKCKLVDKLNEIILSREAENKSLKEHVAMLVPVFVEQQDMKRWDKIACKLEHEKNCWKNLYHNKKDAFLAYQDKAEEVVEKFKLESLDNITKTRKLKEELKSLEETQNINFKEYGNKCIEVNNLKEEIKELKCQTFNQAKIIKQLIKQTNKKSLAELADEKGYFYRVQKYDEWEIFIENYPETSIKKLTGETYAETEAKAREYLESLK